MSSGMVYIPIVRGVIAPVGEGRSSAVESVPVEVWRRVLCISIACPLIPREDDDYFQRRDVADFGCAKIYQYVKSEQIRTKLRLVCQSWDTFLDEHSDRLVHVSSVIPGGHWPPVKKWDRVIRIVGPKSLTCKCVKWCPLTSRIRESMYRRRDGVQFTTATMEAMIRKEYFSSISPQCRSIIWPYTWRNAMLESGRFGSVTMLAEEISDPSGLSIVSKTYRRLTHLEIHLPGLGSQFHLSLPQLTVLVVSVSYTRIDEAGGPASVGRWVLPALTCVTFMEPFSEMAIYYLLEQVGQNVTELHIKSFSDPRGLLKPLVSGTVWSFVPMVTIFGASFTQLLSLEPPASRHDHLVDLIVHLGNDQRDSTPQENSIMEFQRVWASSNIGQVRIDIYWSEWIWISKISPRWFQAIPLKAHLKMFDVFNAMGKGLYDRAGVVFGSTIRAQLCEVLETLEHSAGVSKG